MVNFIVSNNFKLLMINNKLKMYMRMSSQLNFNKLLFIG